MSRYLKEEKAYYTHSFVRANDRTPDILAAATAAADDDDDDDDSE